MPQNTRNPTIKRGHKFYQFGRLALRYYPDRGYKRALSLFRDELHYTRGLMDALKKVGYHDHQRMMTPRQVRIIERYLGEM